MNRDEYIDPSSSAASTQDSPLSIVDHAGHRYDLPVLDGAICATDISQIDPARPLRIYDPGLINTATCRSSITYLDGERGVLEHRGYPIEELAERATYLEVAYLLLNGELPDAWQLRQWEEDVRAHAILPTNAIEFISSFSRNAHPMGMLLATVGALSTCYPDARRVDDPDVRRYQALQLIAKMPVLAALCYRHTRGKQLNVDTDPALSYCGTFLSLLFGEQGETYAVDPRLERALDTMFVLHADHEQNCSTNAVRAVGSSKVDPFSALTAGLAALYGPLHGGASEQVLQMLRRIGSVSEIPAFIEAVKAGRERLMGFGHRVYKSYDPRARLIKVAADDVFAVTGANPLLEVAQELEAIALNDEYFMSRRLYPNVDFYSGLVYEALGLPAEMFPGIFSIPRTSRWLAHWLEMLADHEQKIVRPRQIFSGPPRRSYRSADC